MLHKNERRYRLAKIDFETLLTIFQNETRPEAVKNYHSFLRHVADCDKELHPFKKKGHLKDDEVDDIMKMFDLDEEDETQKKKKYETNHNTTDTNPNETAG